MGYNHRSHQLALIILILLLHAPEGRAAEKTLRRIHDPVVVSGAHLRDLAGRNTAQLRLYRVENGSFVPIPFQFDARDRKGDLTVEGPLDFVFDDNDELVFMAKDAGDEAAGGTTPTGARTTLEILINDADRGERAWVYLSEVADGTPHAQVPPYVVYDTATNTARSAAYEVAYNGTRNFFTGMRITPAGGGTGENLVRQTRMRGSPTLSFFFTDFTIEFTERNSIVEIHGVRNGPVRAVRRVRLSVDLGPMFPELPNGTVYTYHYASTYVTPTRFGVPWLALKTLRRFEFEGVMDFNPAVLPLSYWDGANPEGALLDGQLPTVNTRADHDWWVHSGPSGTVLHAFIIPREWRDWGIARGTVVRHGGDGKRPEASGIAAGYSLLDMTRLREARTYDLLQADFVLPRPYQPGDEELPMAMLQAPLQVSVRRLP